MIYLCAGIGKRCELGYPKQLYKLRDNYLFTIALSTLDSAVQFDTIVITVPKGYIESFTGILRNMNINCSHLVILEGGVTRQESVYKALQECNTEYTIIHESARPFINKVLIENLVKYSEKSPVVPMLPLKFSIYYDGMFQVNRNKFKSVQLPQLFDTQELKIAHTYARDNHKNYTEDSALVADTFKKKITIISGLEENIKITTLFDIVVAEAYWDNWSSV